MPNYNSQLQTNNSSLEEIITQLNNMPDAGESLDTSDATATASDILSGKTAYVSGTKITGTIAFQPAQTITPNTTNQTIASGKYLTGVQTIKGDANLIPSNIVSGKSIFGVVGTATAGGSSGDTSIEDGLVTGTLTTYTNDRVTSIGSAVFYSYPNLTSISFPNCVSINTSAFAYCTSLKNISFPKLTVIGDYAFEECTGLTDISFPQCITVNMFAFTDCKKLKSVNLPLCTNVQTGAFYRCSNLISINMPKCSCIYVNTFYQCYSLTTVNCNNCKEIRGFAFSNCSKLTSISLPACTNIYVDAFFNCFSISSIYLGAAQVCTLSGKGAFSNTGIWSTKGSIFVPASLVASYKAARNWAFFSNRIFSYTF